MEKNTINFQSNTAAGATDEFRHEFEADATVTRLYVEAVEGEQADVRRRWYVEEPSGRERDVLIEATGEQYLAGDGSVFDVKVNEPVEGDETLVLEVDNTDPNYGYPNIAFAEVTRGRSLADLLAEVAS